MPSDAVDRWGNTVSLSLLQRLRLRVLGRVPIGTRMKEGWKNPIMHYVFKCKLHGLQVDYPHGYREELRCPHCEKVFLAKRAKEAK